MPCTANLPASILNENISAERQKVFLNQKKKVLDKILGDSLGKQEVASISYDPDAFINLIDSFIALPNVNGIRVHFASFVNGDPSVPAGKEENLTLIFVPTVAIAGVNIGGQDDPNNYFSIDGSTVTKLPAPSVSGSDLTTRWILNYQKNRRPALIADGRGKVANFLETASLWYPIVAFSDPDFGLQQYLKCLKNTPDDPSNPLDAVVAHFGCFLPVEGPLYPNFQLTVVFNLHQAKDGFTNALAFGSTKVAGGFTATGEISRGTAGALASFHADLQGAADLATTATQEDDTSFALFTGGDADTGLPCPPANGCTGSGFPPNP